jgi:penicillin-binding protein 1B
VVRRFQNKRFSIPSSVYSAPTELRAGLGLDKAGLVRLLTALDYVPAANATPRTGEYSASKNGLQVATHDFSFPGGAPEKSHLALIEFTGAQITALRDAKSKKVLRSLSLEPMLLGRFYGEERETRELVSYKDIEKRFVPSVIAAEDIRFYQHPGVDVRGLLRAAVVNTLRGGIHQGGSTITQQLVKNLWLTPDRTFRRKVSEMLMAILLERHYSKQEILETYANVVYFGRRGSVSILGVGQASRYYFGKPPKDLTWGEAATLAGLIRSPALYNPFSSSEKAAARRNIVLATLLEHKMIGAAAAKSARNESMQTTPPPPVARRASYFVDYVARSLAAEHELAELQTAGLRVHTTLSAPLQLAAEAAVQNGLNFLEKQDKRLAKAELQAALISLDPANGRILAYVGGRDYAESQFDRVSQARRQIGSLVKPFIYYAAVEKGYPATSTWSNEPIVMQTTKGEWRPSNYEPTTDTEVTLRSALERSLNIPTVRISMDVGLPTIKRVLESAGVESPVQAYPALALGALEASPLEMARAYSTLAAQGVRSEPTALTVIGDSDNKVLRRYPLATQPMLNPAVAYVTDQLMMGVVERGTATDAKRIRYAGDLAGKTGTTSDYRDAWFAGTTPNLTTLVWVGSDTNADIRYPGAKLALPLWGEYMMTAVAWIPAVKFGQPEGVTWVDIDPASGEKAGGRCPEIRPEVFLAGSEPTHVCRFHQSPLETIMNLFR